MTLWKRWRSLVAWDGLLPITVAAVPATIRVVCPRNDGAQIVAVVLVPITAALVRAMIGARQLRKLCEGALPILRQIALAIAIILLLLFEVLISAMTFAQGVVLSDWLTTLCVYVCYVAVMALAFAPHRKS